MLQLLNQGRTAPLTDHFTKCWIVAAAWYPEYSRVEETQLLAGCRINVWPFKQIIIAFIYLNFSFSRAAIELEVANKVLAVCRLDGPNVAAAPVGGGWGTQWNLKYVKFDYLCCPH